MVVMTHKLTVVMVEMGPVLLPHESVVTSELNAARIARGNGGLRETYIGYNGLFFQAHYSCLESSLISSFMKNDLRTPIM